MRIVISVLIAACVANGDFLRRHPIVGPKPEPIVFHGFLGLDMDAFKPPQREPGFDEFRKQVDQVEQEEHDHILHELDATKKIEQDFLNSDLHKEAVHSKLFPLIG